MRSSWPPPRTRLACCASSRHPSSMWCYLRSILRRCCRLRSTNITHRSLPIPQSAHAINQSHSNGYCATAWSPRRNTLRRAGQMLLARRRIAALFDRVDVLVTAHHNGAAGPHRRGARILARGVSHGAQTRCRSTRMDCRRSACRAASRAQACLSACRSRVRGSAKRACSRSAHAFEQATEWHRREPNLG